MICGNGDGGIYLINVCIGVFIWGFVMLKCGVNVFFVVVGDKVFMLYGEDNIDNMNFGCV